VSQEALFRNYLPTSYADAGIQRIPRPADENAKVVVLGKDRLAVRRTPKRGLRQVDFVFDEVRGENKTCLLSILKLYLKILMCRIYLAIWAMWSDKQLGISRRWL
jgi:hypothetical protein